MRMTRRRSLLDHLPDPARAFLSRRAAEMTGFAITGTVALLLVALATWTVDDPSLSNAVDGKVRNWLGFPARPSPTC